MKNEEIRINYKDVFAEDYKSAWFDLWRKPQNKRWFVTIAVELTNTEKQPVYTDKFFLLACSPAYLQRPLPKAPKPLPHYTVVQDELNMKELRQIARQRVEAINAKDAVSFEAAMGELFLVRYLPVDI